MDINSLQKLLKHVGEETSSEMQLHTLRTVLIIAQAGESGIQQNELEEKLGMSGGSTSRNVAYWARLRSDKKAGWDMIERFEDEADRRIRIVRLNEKGKRFVEILKLF
jgi:DNA-binding MarR family transcriptional regulator